MNQPILRPVRLFPLRAASMIRRCWAWIGPSFANSQQLLTKVLVIATCLLATHSAFAVDLESSKWGLSGNVAKRQFNLLSLVLRNNSPEAYDGYVRVRKYIGPSPVDVSYVEPVFLSPYSERIVQLYVFAGEWNETWQMTIADQPGAITLPSPAPAPPGVVHLVGNPALSQTLNGIPKVADTYFPVSTAGLNDVSHILLDHQPNWEEARARTLLDWIALGGELHLIPGSSGSLPTFTGPLAVLNAPLDSQRIQAGKVVKHQNSFTKLNTEQIFAQIGRKNPTPDNPNNYYNTIDYEGGEYYNRGFFSTLKEISEPKHLWPLIHLLSLAYIALVFPGAWLLGLKWKSYQITFAITLGAVVIFGGLFQFLGQRGYGEKTQINSVAILRPVADNAWAVEGWASMFVTSSGQRSIRHQGTGLSYATCQSQEAVQGVVRSGTDGSMNVNFPPYSHREFSYRQRIVQPVPQVQWLQLNVNQDVSPPELVSGDLLVSGKFPTTPGSAFLVCGKEVRSLFPVNAPTNEKADANTSAGSQVWNVREKRGELSAFLGGDYGTPFPFASQSSRKMDREQILEKLKPLLTVRAANISEKSSDGIMALPAGKAYAIFFADPPPELELKSSDGILQRGWAAYVLPVPLER